MLKDLEQAIAECQGERNPNANTCIKLAAFLTIRRELFGNSEQQSVPVQMFSSSPVPVQMQAAETPAKVTYSGDSEFAQLINGRDAGEMWALVDDLVTTIGALYPRLYDSFMRELQK